jgi:predicted RND superfamily exporter protein
VVTWLEQWVFRNRGVVLVAAVLVTLATGWGATRVRLDTAFEKHLPVGHEYIDTFLEYRDQMLGVNRVIVVLRARQGDIWNPTFLARLGEATDLVAFLPGIDRRTVTSLWTPNTRTIEITEEGMRSEDVIGGDVTPETLDEEEVARIRDRVIAAGLVGRLVSNDFSAALIAAEALDVDLDTREQVHLLDLARRLETDVRDVLVNDDYDVHIIGFVKMVGDIATGVTLAVGVFFGLALLSTCLAVYVYARSWRLTLLAIGCSLLSGIWQLGVMGMLGYGVDPLAILVPFLVFAIGVSHAIQQINAIAKRVRAGDDSLAAARASFSSLLVPGAMALLTDLVAFATLALIPIPMVRDLAVTASIGVALKILSNLFLLPVLASYLRFDGGFSERFARSEALSAKAMEALSRLAAPRRRVVVLGLLVLLFGVASWQARGRHVGDLQPGATELRPDSRYNRDANLITSRFSFGLDVLTVLAETEEGSCIDYETLDHLDRFSWHMTNVPGVVSVMSTPVVAKYLNSAWNEGNPKWRALPRNRYALMQVTAFIPPQLGLFDSKCTLMPISVFTEDHRAETIRRVVAGAVDFRDRNPSDAVRLRLASGNIGVEAATNEVLEGAELRMLLYAYATILALVALTYRDWRAIVCCCAPLTMATVLGYWFMRELGIGLKVSTLPVMVLAVGIGVDYAFYIYSRLDHHLRSGLDIERAYPNALFETGNAVVFTGITLAIGVSTWAFSPLNFQANMGLLLAFMFFINMIMAVVALPVLAALLHRRGDRR